MKFGKSLSNQIEETLPEWRDKFLSYKDLKKRLKLIEPMVVGERPVKRQRVEGGGGDSAGMTKEEVEFINLLEEELEKFNAFFMEQEEEYIIRLKELQDRVGRAKDSTEEMINIRKEIVDFHGEMVLLENYSALNYTGMVKILKKYDKRTGALIRMPFIQKVLQQPFFTTDLLYNLVKECEKMLDHLFPAKGIPASSSEADEAALANEPTTSLAATVDTNPDEINDGMIQIPKELTDIEHMKNMYMKSTLSALRVLKEIRSRSSTVSHFSLPPLQSSGVEESWKTFPVLEQEAKKISPPFLPLLSL